MFSWDHRSQDQIPTVCRTSSTQDYDTVYALDNLYALPLYSFSLAFTVLPFLVLPNEGLTSS